MPRTLFEISEDLEALYAKLEALGGDVSDPDVEAAIDAWFDELSEARDVKLDNYAALIGELEARAKVRREEARRLADRARRDEEQAKYLKNRLVLFFEQHDLKTVETPRYRLTMAQAGGKLPVLLKADPDQLPEAYQRIKISADLDALREALERGEALAFAELGERSRYLRIS